MINCVIIQGRFASELEMRYTQSNTAVCTSSLATQGKRKNKNGEYDTYFIPCVFWGKTAEHAAQWFNKGDMAIVRGRLESRDWEDKNGQKRRSWEIIAESVDFCGSSKKSENTAAASNTEFTEMEDDGDVPF